MPNIQKFGDDSRVVIGSNSIWELTFKRVAVPGTRANKSVNAVIENVSVNDIANKRELRNGEGDTYGTYYNDRRQNCSVTFYIVADGVSAARNAYKDDLNELLRPSDEVQFVRLSGDTDVFPILEKGRWMIDSITNTRSFGEVRMMTLNITAYEGIT